MSPVRAVSRSRNDAVSPRERQAGQGSSRFVKEIARLGGDVSSFVPAHVRPCLQARREGA
jgi:phosphopantetheine adenylyltransferase